MPNHFTLIVFWCERCNLLCSHSNGDIFTCEDNMLFSHVQISSFRSKAHMVFHWCLYNKIVYQLTFEENNVLFILDSISLEIPRQSSTGKD